MSNLRILVPVKRVIDYAIKPRINKTLTGVEKTGVKFSMNPFDDIAVEEAVRLRERSKAVENIHVVSIGPAKAKDVLITALAKGADDSTLIETDAELEPLAVSKILKEVATKQNANLIILGKQAIDDDANQTGQMLAGLLQWPQATNACKVELQGDKVAVTREIDGGEETIVCSLPCVISTDLRLNEPRYATLPNTMKAKKKPMTKAKLGDYGIDTANRLEILKVEEPGKREPGVIVQSVDDVVAALK